MLTDDKKKYQKLTLKQIVPEIKIKFGKDVHHITVRNVMKYANNLV